jgi:hypothetical protein
VRIYECSRCGQKHAIQPNQGQDEFLDDLDREVVRDMLYERLPTVWQDMLVDIDKGVEPEEVIAEANDGHILRILRKLGFDVDSWLEEFRSFILGGETNQNYNRKYESRSNSSSAQPSVPGGNAE